MSSLFLGPASVRGILISKHRRVYVVKATVPNEALKTINVAPHGLGSIEGLAICHLPFVMCQQNISLWGFSTHALHHAHDLAHLAQVQTEMGVEALTGSAEGFDQFIAVVRTTSRPA